MKMENLIRNQRLRQVTEIKDLRVIIKEDRRPCRPHEAVANKAREVLNGRYTTTCAF